MKSLISSLALAGLASANTEPFMWGVGCPAFEGASNFDLNAYSGRWYSVASTPFRDNQISGDRCVSADYDALPEGEGRISVTNENIDFWTGERYSLVGNAVATEEIGFLSVTFAPRPADPADGNYLVLETDHENIAFVWSCTDYCINFYWGRWCMGHIPVYWVLDRQSSYTEIEVNEKIDRAFDILDEMNYDQHSYNKLMKVMKMENQENCDYESTLTVSVETTEIPVEV